MNRTFWRLIGAGAILTTSLGWTVVLDRDDFVDKDGKTQIQCPSGYNCTMHACPDKFAMGGVLFDGNNFTCRYVGDMTDSYFETKNQRFDMLACKEGYFMTALHSDIGILRCSQTENKVTSGTLVRGARNKMTDCDGSNEDRAAVMLGYRFDRAEMICGILNREEDR